MYLQPKTKHEGKTGHHYIKQARVAKSCAGLSEVWADSDTTLCLTDTGHLAVSRVEGCVALLRISARDYARMRRLESEAAALMARE